MFMANQFYRKALVCATVTCAAVLALAQSSAQPKQKVRTGPRAISVLEMDAKGHARMVPVTILYQDRYYDASQYQSNPVPMVLEPGNVYDVLQANMPIGLFTTGEPRQVRGMWISLGKWKEKGAEPEPKPAKVEVTVADDKGGPVLKRHRGTDSSSDSKADSKTSSKPSDSGPDDPDRPTLKRPEHSEGEPSASQDSHRVIEFRIDSDDCETISCTCGPGLDAGHERNRSGSTGAAQDKGRCKPDERRCEDNGACRPRRWRRLR